MKRLLSCTLLLTLAVSATAQAPPHVVVIVADDLGVGDVGWLGSEIRTPHLDRFAAEGVQLNAHYGHSTCSPARAALLTGRYGFRVGVSRVTTAHRRGGNLKPGTPTFGTVFNSAGYETACVGKWHVGGSPLDHGFEHYYGFPDTPAPDHFRPEGYGATLLGDFAVTRIQQRDPARPMALYLSFNAPHFPLQALPEDLARYPQLAGRRKIFAAMVTALDTQVGRVRDTLEASGMLENTVIVFQSDNGADPRHGGSNGPLRGVKNTPYEGGIRVPACLWSPPRFASRSLDTPTHAVDVLPTLAALAGIDAQSNWDGIDLSPLLAGGSLTRTGLLLAHEPKGFTAYREGRFKLLQERGRCRLFDLSVNETEDVRLRYPIETAQLKRAAQQSVR